MTIQNILNLIGLIINMTGAYMMYHYTPKINSGIYFYQEAEYKKMEEKDRHKNRMVRYGMFLLFIGFVLQFVALFIPTKFWSRHNGLHKIYSLLLSTWEQFYNMLRSPQYQYYHKKY